jgi:hypothetical protein
LPTSAERKLWVPLNYFLLNDDGALPGVRERAGDLVAGRHRDAACDPVFEPTLTVWLAAFTHARTEK